jgi:hypothetical protein
MHLDAVWMPVSIYEETDAPSAAKRRTTWTLPARSLKHAERIAGAGNVNLSTVGAEGLGEVLRKHAAAERADEILRAYQKAFEGFTDEQMLTLDGIIMEPVEE